MKDWKDDSTGREWERQLEDQNDARWDEIHKRISIGLAGSVNPIRAKDLSELINEYYHLREGAIQAIDSANLLPAQVGNAWQRSVGRINLVLQSTGTEFDTLLSQIEDYVE